jgi:tetratricopeptide (TPR) repeat protein
MKTVPLILLAAAVSAVTSAITVTLVLSSSNDAGAPSGPDLDAIRREQAELRESVERLRSSERLDPTQSGADRAAKTPGVTAAQVEAIVSRAMEELVKREEAAQPDPGAVTAALQRLLDPNLTEADRSAIWEQIARAGMLDALVTEFERRALAAPQDSAAQTDLGFAYHQKMRFSGGGPEAGKWGKLGSDAYAKAIELDETNWPARFAQAQHIYYAGMQGDALVHLNVLREQQKTRRPEERHAEAFVLLGNLYLEQGNTAEAKKVWQEGMSLFPGNDRLSALVQTID